MIMKKPIVHDALMRIQDLITRETGTPLRGQAEKSLENIVRSTIGGSPGAPAGDKFSSREITILLADLRGFSAISESYPIGVVLELLNGYLTRMSEVILGHQGVISKFNGDSIMALFSGRTPKDHVRRAVTCAVEMQIAMDELNRRNKQTAIPDLFMGIGINTGTVMAGLVGSELYSDYTVIGNDVNLVSRIEAFSLRGQVLISQSTLEHCTGFATTDELMDVHVKGKANALRLHEVLSIPKLHLDVPRREIRRSVRVRVEIPFTYRVVHNKIVMPETRRGTVLDISYHGVLADIGQQLDPYTEIKFDLDLPLVGYRALDIYAKVLRTRRQRQRHLGSIEFTSVSVPSSANLRHFVQLLVQGSEIL
jgi:adenylate cyclase